MKHAEDSRQDYSQHQATLYDGDNGQDDITVHNTCLIYLDLMRLCSSIPGRFKNWYRQSSGIKDCSPHWQRFWECTRRVMKTSSKEEAKEIRLAYRRELQREVAAQSEEAIFDA